MKKQNSHHLFQNLSDHKHDDDENEADDEDEEEEEEEEEPLGCYDSEHKKSKKHKCCKKKYDPNEVVK